jgi:hypothetical protein
MLKINRLKTKIQVSFRPEESLYSTTLFLCLGISFMLHVLIFKLIHINPLECHHPAKSLRSACVAIDLDSRLVPFTEKEYYIPQLSSSTPPNCPIFSSSLLEPTMAPLSTSTYTDIYESLEYEALEIDFDDDRD